MQIEIVEQFQERLNNLINEIEAYPNEASLWMIKGEINNSGVTLAYHLCGNLNAYIGNMMGNTGYIRNRPI